MDTSRVFKTARGLARRLRQLRATRRKDRKRLLSNREPRRALTPMQREEVYEKTGGRCHICGGEIDRERRWAADHILAYALGGKHEVSNYLPAHGSCNKYRSAYGPEEYKWITKLGVWFRTQITNGSPSAMLLAERFVRHERGRQERRVGSDSKID